MLAAIDVERTITLPAAFGVVCASIGVDARAASRHSSTPAGFDAFRGHAVDRDRPAGSASRTGDARCERLVASSTRCGPPVVSSFAPAQRYRRDVAPVRAFALFKS
jgi:hypothetical protein